MNELREDEGVCCPLTEISQKTPPKKNKTLFLLLRRRPSRVCNRNQHQQRPCLLLRPPCTAVVLAKKNNHHQKTTNPCLLLRPLVQVVQGVLSLVQARLEHPKQGRLAPQVGLGHLVLSRKRAVGHLRACVYVCMSRGGDKKTSIHTSNSETHHKNVPSYGRVSNSAIYTRPIAGFWKQARRPRIIGLFARKQVRHESLPGVFWLRLNFDVLRCKFNL